MAWYLRKQNLVVLITADPKHISLATAAQAMAVTKHTIIQIGITAGMKLSLDTDNHATRNMISKPFRTTMSQFNGLLHRRLKDIIAHGRLTITHVAAAMQKVDKFTKTLKSVIFETQCKMLAVQD